MVANLDDYHDIRTNRIPDMSTNSKILHMATTLINTPPNIPAILNNVNVHQTGLLDARRINFTFNRNYRNLFISYNNQKLNWLNIVHLSQESFTESLLIHMYDSLPSSNHQSFSNTKLIDFVESNLKNANDYLKNIKQFMETLQIKNYLQNNLILAPMDFPGQYNLRKLIINKISTMREYLMKLPT